MRLKPSLDRGGAIIQRRGKTATAKHPIAWRTVLNWVVLAAVPSGLILSTTLHLTTDLVDHAEQYLSDQASVAPGHAHTPLAVMLVLMTKVGAYVILRIWLLVFGSGQPAANTARSRRTRADRCC